MLTRCGIQGRNNVNKSAVLVFFVLFASYALVTSCSRQTSDPAMPPVLELTAVPSPPEPVQIGDLFDFSRCGYKQGVEPIPFVLAVITVRPGDGDDTDLIQQAIDTVSARAPDANAFRGAVLLAEGEFQVNRHLKISANGVVLRGSGNEETRILADGIDRRTLIRVEGAKPEEGSSYTVASAALRAGDTQIELNNAMGLSVGDTVFIDRPASKPWIESLGMNSDTRGFSSKMINWQEGSRVVRWDRTITDVSGNVITLDNPLTTEMSAAMQTQPTVTAYTWQGRLEQQPELLLEIGSNWTARGERVSERVSERRARGEQEASERRARSGERERGAERVSACLLLERSAEAAAGGSRAGGSSSIAHGRRDCSREVHGYCVA